MYGSGSWAVDTLSGAPRSSHMNLGQRKAVFYNQSLYEEAQAGKANIVRPDLVAERRRAGAALFESNWGPKTEGYSTNGKFFWEMNNVNADAFLNKVRTEGPTYGQGVRAVLGGGQMWRPKSPEEIKGVMNKGFATGLTNAPIAPGISSAGRTLSYNAPINTQELLYNRVPWQNVWGSRLAWGAGIGIAGADMAAANISRESFSKSPNDQFNNYMDPQARGGMQARRY
jgi:hypothetical protein